ncbi:hypothetical protein NEMBOFW57_002221 [Staphylotrichum longicolle]|uniref:NADH-ubiquinone oxidoreductase 17.8 kDa subunit n=1 Tax=Staphylotrichum longicolle TaxID=669026 RepID=A0AAD4I2B0_9PEZI|nr:hypothetical protein NEMBOFW57_002221 [Staphylotrichum longicolle]
MSAFRQGAAQLARQARTARSPVVRNIRSYGSSHGHHEAPHTVEESLGNGFFVTLGVVGGSLLVYSISRPGQNGEQSTMHRWLRSWRTTAPSGRRRTPHDGGLEQAAHDRHLLYGAERSKSFELTYPEVFTHGSPFNVPAGHYANIDKVVAHYKQQHLEDEARKAKKLAAASQ